MQQPNNNSVDELNTLLGGEISAVESYKKALQGIDDQSLMPVLEECQVSHARRAQMLRQRVEELGGKPTETSGLWGVFARSVEGTAAAFGDKAAIEVLEEGEDKGLKDYEDRMARFDSESLRLIQSQCYPQQQLTHKTLSDLKQRMS
jgi:uncharacterized protein (TIGR02284 family)